MMEWNVYLEDVNKKEIKVWNVFDHVSFTQEVQDLLRFFSNDKKAFSAELSKKVFYYFAWKSEYEIILTSWPPYITAEEAERIVEKGVPKYRTSCYLETEKKVDIAKQLALNWDRFVDYCWSFIPVTEKKSVQKVKVRKANK